MKPFLFVVGCPRSGTTLLRTMLDSHPDLAVPGESYFIVSMARHRRRYERRHVFRTDLFTADLGRHPWFQQWRLPIDLVVGNLDPSIEALPDAIRTVYRTFAQAHGKPRYADKTPAYTYQMRLLADLFAESRFVHLIRDGRDVAASLAAAHFGPETKAEAAHYWRDHVAAGQRNGALLGPERYLEVKYESLVSSPAAALEEICRFAGLGFAEEMISYPQRAGELLSKMDRRDHLEGISLPPTAGLRDWQADLPATDIAVIELIAGDLLEELGYQPASRLIPEEALHTAASIALRTNRRLKRRRPVEAVRRVNRNTIRPFVRTLSGYATPSRNRKHA